MSISNKPNPSRLHVVHLGTSITDTRVRIMQSQEGTANHFKTKVVVRNPVPVSWIQNNSITQFIIKNVLSRLRNARCQASLRIDDIA